MQTSSLLLQAKSKACPFAEQKGSSVQKSLGEEVQGWRCLFHHLGMFYLFGSLGIVL